MTNLTKQEQAEEWARVEKPYLFTGHFLQNNDIDLVAKLQDSATKIALRRIAALNANGFEIRRKEDEQS
jgi:hypothetical protein